MYYPDLCWGHVYTLRLFTFPCGSGGRLLLNGNSVSRFLWRLLTGFCFLFVLLLLFTSFSVLLASSVGLVLHHWSDLLIILFRFCVCQPVLGMWPWPQMSCTPTSHCPSTSWCPCWRRTGRTSGHSTSKAPWDQPRESSKQMTLVSSNGENGCQDIGFGDEK